MSGFSHFEAVKKLNYLSALPYDLSVEGALSPERIERLQAKGCGWKLLYATERVDETVLDALEDLAHEAEVFDKMGAMQGGKVINAIEGFASEERMVLHTAMRDHFDQPFESQKAQDAARAARGELEKLKTFLTKIDAKYGFTDMVQIGIGGSDLGPRALYLALEAYSLPGRRVHFISNVDPDDAAQILSNLDLKKTAVVVVSKSGTTLETLTNEALVRQAYRKAGLDPRSHFIAVTGEKSPMDNPEEYLASFYMWDYVGGRYSATSMVGGVTLAFALGFEAFWELLRGAHDMDVVARSRQVWQNLPLMAALLGVWNRNFLGCATLAVLPYSQALIRFTAHLQQCDMESNGKSIDKMGRKVSFPTGPVVWGEPGTNGQHSFYQLIHQGTDTIACELIGFGESQREEDLLIQGTTSQQKLVANLLAQSIALATGKHDDNPNKRFAGNRPNSLLVAQRLDPYHMGALLSYYENKVAFQGFLWGINSFDQEGVQLGKVLATRILDLQKKEAAPSSFPAAATLLQAMATWEER